MTVITTVISRECIVHASDSFLTQPRPDGTLKVIQTQARKLLAVRACRGALAFYGLAGDMKGWTTLAWLRSIANRQIPEPEAFARQLAVELEAELRRLGLHRRSGYGIGIHFAAYERVDNYWIPELFHITNWKDPSYWALRPGGVGVSRDSFPTMFPASPRRSHQTERRALREALREGRFLQFNNGNPTLFNPVARAFRDMVRGVGPKGRRTMGVEFWRALARRPVQAVSDVARDFLKPEYRAMGGQTRDLALTPNGEYSSKSGDR